MEKYQIYYCMNTKSGTTEYKFPVRTVQYRRRLKNSTVTKFYHYKFRCITNDSNNSKFYVNLKQVQM